MLRACSALQHRRRESRPTHRKLRAREQPILHDHYPYLLRDWLRTVPNPRGKTGIKAGDTRDEKVMLTRVSFAEEVRLGG